MNQEKEKGLAAQKVAQQLASFRAAIEAMANEHRGGALARLKMGQLYYEVTHQTEIDYGALDAYMVQHHNVQLPSKSTMSRLRQVYETWHLQSKVPLEELASFSSYLLHQVAIRTVVTAKTAPMWLQRMRVHTREQVIEAASGLADADTKPKGDRGKFVNIPIEENVATMLADARVRLAEAVGERTLSNTAFIEFIAALINESSDRSLRVYWAKMHGEDLPDGDG